MITSVKKSYETLRKVIAADTPITAIGWKDKPAAAVNIDRRINLVELGVIFGGAATAANINIYAYRQGGAACKVCSFTANAGAAVVGSHPHTQEVSTDVYADELATVVGTWFDTIKTADASGDDGVARAMFDAYGAAYLYAEVTSITGSGSVEVIYAGV